MAHKSFNDLYTFMVISEHGSFTKAAAKLGIGQSALSQTIKTLEEQLGVRLLSRTTRSVALTPAGERLLQTLKPSFENIEAQIDALSDFRDKPAGTIRITASEHAADSILWPKLEKFLPNFPDIHVEVCIDYTLTDLVHEKFDVGVRLGEQVEKDMIAVRIGPDFKVNIVGSPTYFNGRSRPLVPKALMEHQCINMRLPTHGGLLVWDFEKNGEINKIRPSGQLTLNTGTSILRAALAGFGLAFLPEDMVAEHIKAGRLVSVLDDWCENFPGYHLYYPSRRQTSPALKLLIEALRYS